MARRIRGSAESRSQLQQTTTDDLRDLRYYGVAVGAESGTVQFGASPISHADRSGEGYGQPVRARTRSFRFSIGFAIRFVDRRRGFKVPEPPPSPALGVGHD